MHTFHSKDNLFTIRTHIGLHGDLEPINIINTNWLFPAHDLIYSFSGDIYNKLHWSLRNINMNIIAFAISVILVVNSEKYLYISCSLVTKTIYLYTNDLKDLIV